jgi:transposase-like protein
MSGTAKYDRQAILAAAQKHAGNVRAVAKELGCAESTVRLNLQAAGEKYGNAVGRPVAGATTLYKGDGEVVLQWVRGPDEVEQRLRDAFDALKQSIPKAKPTGQTKAKRSQDLMNVHVLTDYHLGSKAWREEAGEDWDLPIAEDLLVRWFTCAIENAPESPSGQRGASSK